MRGEVNRSKRSNCSGGYMSRTLGIFGMDRMLELLRGSNEQDEQDEQDETLKGVNGFNMLKGVNECKRV